MSNDTVFRGYSVIVLLSAYDSRGTVITQATLISASIDGKLGGKAVNKSVPIQTNLAKSALPGVSKIEITASGG
jgi:hypothetical protein